MSKFDDTISTKLKQLNEVATGFTGNQPQNSGTPGLVGNRTTSTSQATPTGQANPTGATPATPTGAADPTKAQDPQAQQNQQPQQAQAGDLGAELAKVFQSFKFDDPNSTVTAFNNAMKTAGNAPGIKDFFSSLAFDPQKGFLVAQAQAPATGAAPIK